MWKSFYQTLLVLFLVAIINPVFAYPKEIIIIRHADKLVQPEPGPTLSPQGLVRSLAFANYFINKFGAPDFIVATAPMNEQSKDSSIRELQTIAPLANMLAAQHVQTGFPILHPYKSSDYAKLNN